MMAQDYPNHQCLRLLCHTGGICGALLVNMKYVSKQPLEDSIM